MSCQEKVLQTLKDLGGRARVVEIRKRMVVNGMLTAESPPSGNLNERLRSLSKWGIVKKISRGTWEIVPSSSDVGDPIDVDVA